MDHKDLTEVKSETNTSPKGHPTRKGRSRGHRANPREVTSDRHEAGGPTASSKNKKGKKGKTKANKNTN